MSTIKYPITLDLKRDYHQVLVMKEGDFNSREIIITITDNGNPYDLTDRLVKFKWHKPDHHFVFEDCTIFENKAVLTCSEQMLITSGLAKCEVILYDDSAKENESVLSTMEFDVSIRPSVISNTDIESSDEFGTLNNLILSNKDLNESLKQLETDVEEAENTRISNENTRINNETNRISAEAQRQTDTANAITNANTAASNADTAKKNANEAAMAAVDATENTNNATKKATTLIEKMETLIKSDNLIHTDDLGTAGGVATLDENGNIPANQLPSYVDDVLEGHATGASLNSAGNAMCASGFILKDETEECLPESGKIYVDTDTNLQYRWTGSTYISTGSVLELGTTSSTAFPGNRGLSLENRVTDIEEYHHNIPATDIKFDNTETSLLGANVQNVLEELSQEATPISKGLLSAEDKKRIDNYANIETIDTVLLASNWIGDSAPFTQTVAVPNLSVYNNCSIELPETASADEENAAAEADISGITYDETIGLTFTANGAKPKINIPIQLTVGTSINVVEVPKYFDKTPVMGVKGAAETEYRNGNVNLTFNDIGALSDIEKDSTVEGTLAYSLENFKKSISIASKTLYSYYTDGLSLETSGYTIPNYISEVSGSLQNIVSMVDELNSKLVTISGQQADIGHGLHLEWTKKDNICWLVICGTLDKDFSAYTSYMLGNLSIWRNNGIMPRRNWLPMPEFNSLSVASVYFDETYMYVRLPQKMNIGGSFYAMGMYFTN